MNFSLSQLYVRVNYNIKVLNWQKTFNTSGLEKVSLIKYLRPFIEQTITFR